jgi:hypothetical protein
MKVTPELINAVITVLTPMIIAAVKAAIPRIKPVYLPLAAPVLGVAIAALASYSGTADISPVAGAIAGGLGVWLREAVDQVKKSIPPTPPAL